jgi:hypothetical protein
MAEFKLSRLKFTWKGAWSPVTQYITSDGSSLTFDLDNSLAYTNPVNMIVTVNGVRARTAAGASGAGYGGGSC